jgi:hypothetical protein
MSLKDKIKEAMTSAMKAKESERLMAIRNIWNAIRKKEIDDRKDLTDTDIEKVVMTLSKQLQEGFDQAKTSGRTDIAAELEKELKIYKEFQPEMMSLDELQKLVSQIVADLKTAGTLPAGNAGMGQVMKKTMEAVGSKAEGRSVQEAVRKALQS